MPARKRHREQQRKTTAWTDLVTLITSDDDCADLTERAYSPARTTPLLLLTCPSDTHLPRIDVTDLIDAAERPLDVAAVQEPDIAWSLNHLLGPALKAYGGAIRLIWPGAQPSDDPYRHPLFLTPTDADGPKTIAAILDTLDRPPTAARPGALRPALASTPPPPAPHLRLVPKPGPAAREVSETVPGRDVRSEPAPPALPPEVIEPSPLAVANERLNDAQHEIATLRTRNDNLSYALTATRERLRSVHDAARATDSEVERLRADLADARARANASPVDQAALDAQWSTLVAVAKAERDEATARAERADAETVRLRKKVKSLTAQVADVKTRLTGRSVFADPGTQFRHEVTQDWLHNVEETHRDSDRALRAYTLGPDFLDSVATLGQAYRERVVTVAREIITNHVWASNGRSARQFRESANHDAPARVREDGAVAWRCDLQTNAASARRFMWWELPDGSVELGRVAIHDDTALR